MMGLPALAAVLFFLRRHQGDALLRESLRKVFLPALSKKVFYATNITLPDLSKRAAKNKKSKVNMATKIELCVSGTMDAEAEGLPGVYPCPLEVFVFTHDVEVPRHLN